ncbi:hypothetical protein V5N11_006829 [Cardamine amara subsp. amara]|uniref:Reverse transcriptase zinc-binding domain-containing protein n=1 Tax=Cardamine amara subsp. amara TaxID=228776 RepID=A0ABD1AUT0_CARAN
MCGQADESIQHLFFSCSYPSEVWNSVLVHARLNHPNQLNVIVNWVKSPSNLTKLNIICKLILQASVYELWAERNARLHLASLRSAVSIVKHICLTLRSKLISMDRPTSPSSSSSISRQGQSFLSTWFQFIQP